MLQVLCAIQILWHGSNYIRVYFYFFFENILKEENNKISHVIFLKQREDMCKCNNYLMGELINMEKLILSF